MNIRLNKKSIIMATYIILIAAIIAIGTRHAHAEKDMIKKNKHLGAAFLQGGDGIAKGLSMLMPDAMQQIMCTADGALPDMMCVNVLNLGEDALQVFYMMGRDHEPIGCGMVYPGQTKAICLPSGRVTSLALQGYGLALWRVGMVHGNNAASE